jgi:hypothetical protein
VPSIPARIANHFMESLSDRVVPNVTLSGHLRAPAITLPSAVDAATVSSVRDLEFTLSDRRPNWNDRRARHDVAAMAFDGTALGGTAALTMNDEAALEAIRAHRGLSSAGTDAVLEKLYDTYSTLSRTLARDIIAKLSETRGVEHLPTAMPWMPGNSRFGWTIGRADGSAYDGLYENEFDLALRFLKSDLTTSVSFEINTIKFLDTHGANPYPTSKIYLRGAMETIGRLIAELKLTPSPSRRDRTLLDETLVYITSDFGRTYPAGGGSDHHPIHSAVLVNGLIQGNRMIGAVGEDWLGTPVAITEESGDRTMRPPTARDVGATISACFGLSSEEAFLPGGYGVVDGIVPV